MFRYCLVWEKHKFTRMLKGTDKNEDTCIFYKDNQPTIHNTLMEIHKRRIPKAVDKQSNYGGHKEKCLKVKTVNVFQLLTKLIDVITKHPTQKPVDLLEWLAKTYTT